MAMNYIVLDMEWNQPWPGSYAARKVLPVEIHGEIIQIGAVRMLDDGKMDDKVIAIPFSDPTYLGITSIDELPPHIFDEIMHFFSVYKQLENKQTAVKELFDRKEAEEIIQMCIDQYNEKFVNGQGE